MKPKLKEFGTGMLCTEVAARLITGADIASAQEVTLYRLYSDLDFVVVKAFAENPHENQRHRFRGQVMCNPLTTPHHKEATVAVPCAMFIVTAIPIEVGAPLVEILTRVADGIAAQPEAGAKRHAAQVGPHATARLLGVLSLAALAMASFIRVDVPGMTLPGGLNVGIFVVGAVLMVVGNLWSHAMIRRVMNLGVSSLNPTLAMDIIAACQESGASSMASLQAVNAASNETDLAVVAWMPPLGASWEEAWLDSDEKWEQLPDVLQPAWEEGALSVSLLVRGVV